MPPKNKIWGGYALPISLLKIFMAILERCLKGSVTPSRVQQCEGNEAVSVLRAASRILCSGDTLETVLQLCTFAVLLLARE